MALQPLHQVRDRSGAVSQFTLFDKLQDFGGVGFRPVDLRLEPQAGISLLDLRHDAERVLHLAQGVIE